MRPWRALLLEWFFNHVMSVCVATQTKEKYEKALDELSKCTPSYMENMEQVFDQCQQFEEKRLSFLREVLLDVKRHLNLTENQRSDMTESVTITRQQSCKHYPFTKSPLSVHSYATVYRELERTITSASPQEDLKWFSNAHGPGMHMNWPQFEVIKH